MNNLDALIWEDDVRQIDDFLALIPKPPKKPYKNHARMVKLIDEYLIYHSLIKAKEEKNAFMARIIMGMVSLDSKTGKISFLTKNGLTTSDRDSLNLFLFNSVEGQMLESSEFLRR